MTAKANPIFNLLALFGDTLTAYRLEYKSDRPTHDETRFTAAARIASDPYGVIPYDTPGYYSVSSDDPKNPMRRFDVCALPGDLACDCHDATDSRFNRSNLCKHILSAVMRRALEEA